MFTFTSKEITTKVEYAVKFVSTSGTKYQDSFNNLEDAIAYATHFKDNKDYVSIKIYMIEEKAIFTAK